MLSSLTISNVALISKQTVEFNSGFNCILGQSGAGKSIIIDALSFLLGAKADKNLIRTGQQMMRVDGVFVNLNQEVVSFLNDLDIYEEELIISRTLSIDGKSGIKICGYPATLKTLVQLSEKLADFCGQHDSVGLINTNNHLMLLDKFVGSAGIDLKAQVAQLYAQLKNIESVIASLGGNAAEREREKDILQFQIDEIENAKLQIGEREALQERFDYISSAEKIAEGLKQANTLLDGQSESVVGLLYQAKSALSGVSAFKEVQQQKERIENCYYELQDVAESLQNLADSTEFDPLELERIDARLDVLKALSKKYGKTVEDILDWKEKSQTRLDELSSGAEKIEKLTKQKQKVQEQLQQVCQKLSAVRKQFAKQLEQKLENELADLEMKGTNFKIDFKQVECHKNGYDDVKFMFSANVGQEVKDLHKTASGGELSRLLLAFKNVMLDKEQVQTVVFDEIDSGISGVAAGQLANKLKNISAFSQIICITHTPVVAAKANNFLLAQKQTSGQSTTTSVSRLDEKSAVEEVARLIDSSRQLSETAIMHAKKLFEK